MLRSLFTVCSSQSFSVIVAGRTLQRALPTKTQHALSLHLSAHNFAGDKSSRPKKGKDRNVTDQEQEKSKMRPVSQELKKAAVKAAKSLPGDWTINAEELVKRLSLCENPEEKTNLNESEEDKKSLLQTMDIQRSAQRMKYNRSKSTQDLSAQEANNTEDNRLYSQTVVQNDSYGTRQNVRVARRRDDYNELFKAPRLGIFDAAKLKREMVDEQSISREPLDLWAKVDAEKVRRALGAVPRNAFEEMIQWTNAGKLWQFPIDNEADMHEERKYKFHDHIFLERHLTEFPDKGPIRKFMELVVIGLSKNPWITVPEKIEHIQWFSNYFREKQDVLEATIGEQGIMKSKQQLE